MTYKDYLIQNNTYNFYKKFIGLIKIIKHSKNMLG